MKRDFASFAESRRRRAVIQPTLDKYGLAVFVVVLVVIVSALEMVFGGFQHV